MEVAVLLRAPVKLGLAETKVLYVEDILDVSPLFRPNLLIMNLGGVNVTAKLEVVLDMGTLDTDTLNTGIYTQTVKPTTTIAGGANLAMDITALSAITALQTQLSVFGQPYKVLHKLTLINTSGASQPIVQLLLSGSVEQFINPTQLPLQNLIR